MKNEKEVSEVKEKLERFRKDKHNEFGGSDYPKLRGWIDALSWILDDEDYMVYVKKKFSPKVVELFSKFR